MTLPSRGHCQERLRLIFPEEEEYVGVGYLPYGIGHSTTTEACGQTGHGGGVSGTGAHIHAIGPHHCTGELHHQIVLFVSAPGGTNTGYALGTVFLLYFQ